MVRGDVLGEQLMRAGGQVADIEVLLGPVRHREQLATANATAASAAEDAASARTLALVGIVIGLLGVAAAGTAVFVARRPKAST